MVTFDDRDFCIRISLAIMITAVSGFSCVGNIIIIEFGENTRGMTPMNIGDILTIIFICTSILVPIFLIHTSTIVISAVATSIGVTCNLVTNIICDGAMSWYAIVSLINGGMGCEYLYFTLTSTRSNRVDASIV